MNSLDGGTAHHALCLRVFVHDHPLKRAEPHLARADLDVSLVRIPRCPPGAADDQQRRCGSRVLAPTGDARR